MVLSIIIYIMDRYLIIAIVTILAISTFVSFSSISAQPFINNFNSFSNTNVLNSVLSENRENKIVEIAGILSIFWVDYGSEQTHNNNHQEFSYNLMDATGKFYQLILPDDVKEQIDGFVSLNGQIVSVTGTLNNSDTSGISIINVQKLRLIDINETIKPNELNDNVTIKTHVPTPPGSNVFIEHVSGSQNFVTILCRFGDSTDFTPQPPSYAETLIDRVDKYYQEVSYNNINLDGSDVVGWFNMPDPRSDYSGEGLPVPINIGKLFNDCASTADDDVFFPDYDGINFFFNQNLFGGVLGFGANNILLFVDGEFKFYRITFMSLSGWNNQDVLAHEMGHSFGLPHSSGPYDTPYDSNWDVMSSNLPCLHPNPDFRCHGPHTNSFYKYAIGWIDPSRAFIATSANDQFVFLERLANPKSTGYLTAVIPINNSNTDLYSIEARTPIEYDKNEIPNSGILIHKINLTSSSLDDKIAEVVDNSFNFNPNDAGATWVPGETFVDEINNISVKVIKETKTGFWVVINPTDRYPPFDLHNSYDYNVGYHY